MNADSLAAYVGAPGTTQPVQDAWNTAVALVDAYVGAREVPETIKARAYLEVGAELFHRKNTKNAVAQFATPEGAPFRVARDPMVAAHPLLSRFVGGGFA